MLNIYITTTVWCLNIQIIVLVGPMVRLLFWWGQWSDYCWQKISNHVERKYLRYQLLLHIRFALLLFALVMIISSCWSWWRILERVDFIDVLLDGVQKLLSLCSYCGLVIRVTIALCLFDARSFQVWRWPLSLQLDRCTVGHQACTSYYPLGPLVSKQRFVYLCKVR